MRWSSLFGILLSLCFIFPIGNNWHCQCRVLRHQSDTHLVTHRVTLCWLSVYSERSSSTQVSQADYKNMKNLKHALNSLFESFSVSIFAIVFHQTAFVLIDGSFIYRDVGNKTICRFEQVYCRSILPTMLSLPSRGLVATSLNSPFLLAAELYLVSMNRVFVDSNLKIQRSSKTTQTQRIESSPLKIVTGMTLYCWGAALIALVRYW